MDVLRKMELINGLLKKHPDGRAINLEEYIEIADQILFLWKGEALIGLSFFQYQKILTGTNIILLIDKNYCGSSEIETLIQGTIDKIINDGRSTEGIIVNLLIDEKSNESNWVQVIRSIVEKWPNQFEIVEVCKLKI